MVTKCYSSLNKPVVKDTSLFKYLSSFVTTTLQRVSMKETRMQPFDQDCISQLNLSLIFFQAAPVVGLIVLKLDKRIGDCFNSHG